MSEIKSNNDRNIVKKVMSRLFVGILLIASVLIGLLTVIPEKVRAETRSFIVCMTLIVVFALGYSVSAAVASPTVAQLQSPNEFSPGAITINFEGLSGSLSNQIPGLTFFGTSVVDPAEIGSSTGRPLSAATSGTAAAFGAGSKIDFSTSVTEVGMFVSPTFITISGGVPLIFKNFSLVALDSTNTSMGVVTVPVLVATPPHRGHRSHSYISWAQIRHTYRCDQC